MRDPNGYKIDMTKSMGHSLLRYPPNTVNCTQFETNLVDNHVTENSQRNPPTYKRY